MKISIFPESHQICEARLLCQWQPVSISIKLRAKKLATRGFFHYGMALFNTFLKWNLFVVSIWGTQLTTLLSTSLLLFTSSPLLIAILKDQNVIGEDRIQEKKYRFFMFHRVFIYQLSQFYKNIKDDIFYKSRKITKRRITPNVQ